MRIERRTLSDLPAVGGLPKAEHSDVSSAPAPLPSPSTTAILSADPATAMAALMVQAGARSRTAAETLRRSQEAMIERHEREQIDALERKAADTRVQGWVEGLSTSGQGALQLGSAELLCQAAESGAPAKARKLEAASGRWLAAAKIGEGVGKLGATEIAVLGEHAQVEATRHGQEAERAKRAADDARTGEREAEQWIAAALQFCREYASTRAAAEGAALRRG